MKYFILILVLSFQFSANLVLADDGISFPDNLDLSVNPEEVFDLDNSVKVSAPRPLRTRKQIHCVTNVAEIQSELLKKSSACSGAYVESETEHYFGYTMYCNGKEAFNLLAQISFLKQFETRREVIRARMYARLVDVMIENGFTLPNTESPLTFVKLQR